MLSDKGIKDLIKRGLLNVEPTAKIGPASIDLHIDNRLYRSDPQAHLSYQEEIYKLTEQGLFHKFVERLEEPSLPFDQYVSRFGIPVTSIDGSWILEPDKLYYTETDETITTREGIRVQIATRSSLARIGLRVQYSEEKLDKSHTFKGKPFLVLRTYGTHVELPQNYSVCQMVVEPSANLSNEGIEESIRRGDITVSGNPEIAFDSIILTFHPKLLRYNGRTTNPCQDNSKCFEEVNITNGFLLKPGEFYLGSTQETVGIGRKHVGILDEFFGLDDVNILRALFPLAISQNKPYPFSSRYVHLNAPYHWPGSNHRITLEIFPTTQEHIKVKAGDPACRLLIQELYPECEFPYNSKFSGQEGPTVSRI